MVVSANKEQVNSSCTPVAYVQQTKVRKQVSKVLKLCQEEDVVFHRHQRHAVQQAVGSAQCHNTCNGSLQHNNANNVAM